MTLLDLVRLVRHNLRIILVAAIIGLGAAAGYAALQPVVYQSQATGVVVAGDASTVGGAMSGSALAQSRAGTYAMLAGTSEVKKRASEYEEIKAAPDALTGSLSGEVVGASNMLRITATGTSGENARLLADAGLKAVGEEALRLETMTSEQGGQISPESVAVRIAPYIQADASSQPVSPDWFKLLGLGLLGGLGLGAVTAFLRYKLDVKVRTMAQVEEETGRSVLAVIPDSKELAKHRDGTPIKLSELGAAGEALRQLRTNLRYVDVDNPPRAVVVTSATPAEGKSTISSLLAVLVARSGQPVVLVDADLRKPVQHKIFSADHGVGLAQVLVGDVGIADALQPTNEPNLKVLTSGKVPSNPSEMVGSRRMRNLITELSKQYFVIIDAPPILAVTDAGLLGAATDGVVLVTRVGRTQREQLRMSVKLVEQVGGNILGTVMHRAPRKSMGDVIYGAGYGGSYQTYYGTGYYTDGGVQEDPTPITAVPTGPRTSPGQERNVPDWASDEHSPQGPH